MAAISPNKIMTRKLPFAKRFAFGRSTSNMPHFPALARPLH
jgi:hypothetical protein